MNEKWSGAVNITLSMNAAGNVGAHESAIAK